MKRRQVTLKGLMIAIVAISVGLVTLVRSSMLWGMILSFLLWTLFLTSILGILYRRGPKRAFWVGFALFAWAYLILFWSITIPNSSFPLAGRLIAAWQGGLIELLMIPSLEPEKLREILGNLSGMVTDVTEEIRIGVGALILALAFATLGGRIALAFANSEARSKRPDDGPSPGRGGAEPPEAAASRG